MNLVHQNGHHFLISASRAELENLVNTLNEICHGLPIEDHKFETRLGGPAQNLGSLLTSLGSFLSAKPAPNFFSLDAFADGYSVQARCIGSDGSYADMSSNEAREFARLLISAADKADLP